MEIATMEDFARLEQKVSATQKLLSDLLAIIGEPVLSFSDIAEREGISKSMLYKEPWRLPNYGQSDFSTGNRRWKLQSYLKWSERDQEQREKEWNLMTTEDREKIVIGQF